MQNGKKHNTNSCPFPKGTTAREILNNHLILEEPPPEAFKRYKRSKWHMVTNALKLRPGRWYRIQVYDDPKSASSAVTRLKKEFGKQGFEFVHADGKVWGKYSSHHKGSASSEGVLIEALGAS